MIVFEPKHVSIKMATKNNEYLRDPPDGGWGWLIVAGGMYCLAMWGGIVRCYSVFYTDMMAEFGAEYGTVSWINGMYQISYGAFTVIGPILMKRFQARWLCLIAGFIGGFSCFLASFMQTLWAVQVLMGLMAGATIGMLSISIFTTVNRYFKKKVYMANQLVCLGVAVGPLLICPGYQYLAIEFGWRGACQIVAGLLMNTAVAGALLRPIKLQSDLDINNEAAKEIIELTDKNPEDGVTHSNEDDIDVEILGDRSSGYHFPPISVKSPDIDCDNKQHNEEKSLTLQSNGVDDISSDSKFKKCCKAYYLALFIDLRFYIYALSWTTFAAAFFSATTYIIPYGKTNLGLTEYKASTLVSAFAGGEIFSRIVYTLFFDRMPQRLRILYVCVLFGALSIVILILAFVKSYITAMLCCVLIGALGGGADGIYSAIIGELFDIQQYAFVYGYSNIIIHGTGSLATVLIGVAVDKLEDLAVAFYIGFGFAVTSSILVFALHKTVEVRKKNMSKKEQKLIKKRIVNNLNITQAD